MLPVHKTRMRSLLALVLSMLFFGLMFSISYEDGLREDLHMTEQKIDQVAAAAAQKIAENLTEPIRYSREKFPWKPAIATVFWVGEESGPENAFIPNAMSAFDEQWQEHYGGVDDPQNRCGFHPCSFVPKENPFYIALPYSDFEDDGTRRSNVINIPWYDASTTSSLVKNRWVEIKAGSKVCFAQWQDVGPLEENDFAYVFGESIKPLNTFSARAGIDLSPAVRDCLKMGDVSEVQWRHVEFERVPEGPWKEIITSS